MSDETDRMYDPIDDMSEEDIKAYNADSFDMLRYTFKQDLKQKSDTKLLNKLTHYPQDRAFINNIVPNGRFKAFDIAMQLKKNNASLSPNQRNAFINVLAYYEAKKHL